MHETKSFGFRVLMFLRSQGYVSTHMLPCSTKEAVKLDCFKARPFAQCADAEGRAFLWFLLPTAYACECWDLSKMPARTPDMKRGELATSF
jgi:hypothetical protein